MIATIVQVTSATLIVAFAIRLLVAVASESHDVSCPFCGGRRDRNVWRAGLACYLVERAETPENGTNPPKTSE